MHPSAGNYPVLNWIIAVTCQQANLYQLNRLLSSSELNNSQQMNAYELVFIGSASRQVPRIHKLQIAWLLQFQG